MKKPIANFKKRDGMHVPLAINGAELEMIECFTVLSVNITNNLFWFNHFDATTRKTHPRLYFLTRIFDMAPITLTNSYRCTIERILSRCIAA